MQKLIPIAKETEIVRIHLEDFLDKESLYLLYLNIVVKAGIAIHIIKNPAGYALNNSPASPAIINNPTTNNSPKIISIVETHCINILKKLATLWSITKLLYRNFFSRLLILFCHL